MADGIEMPANARSPLSLLLPLANHMQGLCFSFNMNGLQLHVVNRDYLNVRLVDRIGPEANGEMEYIRLLGDKTYR